MTHHLNSCKLDLAGFIDLLFQLLFNLLPNIIPVILAARSMFIPCTTWSIRSWKRKDELFYEWFNKFALCIVILLCGLALLTKQLWMYWDICILNSHKVFCTPGFGRCPCGSFGFPAFLSLLIQFPMVLNNGPELGKREFDSHS